MSSLPGLLSRREQLATAVSKPSGFHAPRRQAVRGLVPEVGCQLDLVAETGALEEAVGRKAPELRERQRRDEPMERAEEAVEAAKPLAVPLERLAIEVPHRRDAVKERKEC